MLTIQLYFQGSADWIIGLMLVVLPVPLDQIEQIHCAKLLGIYLSDTLQFETHLVNLLKICSIGGSTYLLNTLRVYIIKLYNNSFWYFLWLTKATASALQLGY